MSVWVCVPSKRPPAEVEKWAQAWRDMGYEVLIWRDEPASTWRKMSEGLVNIMGGGEYPGYAQATNTLIRVAIEDFDARYCVIGGDDVWPETERTASEIERECLAHFADVPIGVEPGNEGETFGVMQPTGDRWGDSEQARDQYGKDRGAYVDRIAGSAWIGREFALRAYGGNGPLWPEYFHMYPDEELQLVAQKLGVFWQRPDLTQIHQHWGRPKEGETMGHSHNMPEFLKRANSDKEWDAAKKLFEARKAAGFPGHEVKA